MCRVGVGGGTAPGTFGSVSERGGSRGNERSPRDPPAGLRPGALPWAEGVRPSGASGLEGRRPALPQPRPTAWVCGPNTRRVTPYSASRTLAMLTTVPPPVVLDLGHEPAHQQQPAAARPLQVLDGGRVGDVLRALKPVPSSVMRMSNRSGGDACRQTNDPLVRVHLVAVLDGVDQGLLEGQADRRRCRARSTRTPGGRPRSAPGPGGPRPGRSAMVTSEGVGRDGTWGSRPRDVRRARPAARANRARPVRTPAARPARRRRSSGSGPAW